MNADLSDVKHVKNKSIKTVLKESYNKVYEKIMNEKINEIEPLQKLD
jgi:hypothetical protein